MKIFMFPGQGSQHLRMGEALFQQFPRKTTLASEILGYDILEVCLQDKSNLLNKTKYTQPLLYLVCCLQFLSTQEKPDKLLGHSLGLYPALFAANVFSFEQGLKIVKKRAELMAEAKNGAMVAILGAEFETINSLLLENSFYDIDIANDNAPNQQVLSGKKSRLQELSSIIQSKGYRVIPLQVSGAFHSRYMQPVTTEFFEFLAEQTFKPTSLPVISSTHAQQLNGNHILEELAYQLIKPVRWRQVIQYLISADPETEFYEIGPGNVLTSLVHQIKNYAEDHKKIEVSIS